MANVLNPETESITLSTELETPTLDPATELEQPSPESTSTPEPEAIATPALDADPTPQPVAEITEPVPAPEVEAAPAPVAEAPEYPAAEAHFEAEHEHMESMEDFSAALEAFEREQAAEAAAVEAYGDKIVSGTVVKQTEKHLVVDVGLKSEGLVPLEQVTDHTGAVKFVAGDVIDVVIEHEEPEGGYLVSYEKAQRLRVWDSGDRHCCEPR
jgi:small subunit ribosomal protein S1